MFSFSILVSQREELNHEEHEGHEGEKDAKVREEGLQLAQRQIVVQSFGLRPNGHAQRAELDAVYAAIRGRSPGAERNRKKMPDAVCETFGFRLND